MKTEISINPKFLYLTEFINQIPERFDSMGQEIKRGRNELRVVSVDGQILTIKYFKRITLANRFIFATFRKSKACRAYRNSQQLTQKEITTPEPVAFINIYCNSLLYRSYFISLFISYKPLKELFALPLIASEGALKAFARFTYRIHSAGILHQDYNIDNVLYLYADNEYDFALIDNNRMRFCRYSYWRGIRNLERLKIPVDKMGIIAAEYAKEAHASDVETLNGMVFYRLKYLTRKMIERRLKGLLSKLMSKNQPSVIAY